MRLLRIVSTVGVIITLAVTLTVRPAGVSAGRAVSLHTPRPLAPSNSSDEFSNDAYDIAANNNYCVGGGSACATINGVVVNCYEFYACPGLVYAGASSYGPFNGNTTGTPAAIYVECTVYTTYGYTDAYMYVTSDPADYPTGYDLGTITGKSGLLDWYPAADTYGSEGNPSQVSSQSFSVYDPAIQTRASVTGIQNTNNQADSLNSGSTRITISGRIYTYDKSGNTYQVSPTELQDSNGKYYYNGMTTCTAGGPHANDLANAGFQGYGTFEGEMESTIGNPEIDQPLP